MRGDERRRRAIKFLRLNGVARKKAAEKLLSGAELSAPAGNRLCRILPERVRGPSLYH